MGWPFEAVSCPSTDKIKKRLYDKILCCKETFSTGNVCGRKKWIVVVFVGLNDL